MGKGSHKLREGRKTLNDILDDEFTARQFVDKWLTTCGGRICPHVAGAKTIIIKLGCKKTGRQIRGADLFKKPDVNE